MSSVSEEGPASSAWVLASARPLPISATHMGRNKGYNGYALEGGHFIRHNVSILGGNLTIQTVNISATSGVTILLYSHNLPLLLSR